MWHSACAVSGNHDAPALLCTIDLLRKSLFPYLLFSLSLFHTLFTFLISLPLSFMYIYMSTRVGTLIVATIYLQLIQKDTCFEVLLSFIVVTSIVYNPLPAMWNS